MSVSAREPFFKKADRLVLLLCLIGLLLTGAILKSDALFFRLFGSNDNSSTTPRIGLISSYSRDARHKSFGSLAWTKAKPNESVHIGDSVFTAANSQVVVKLKNNSEVQLGQNSMVTFRSMNNLEVPDFAVGNFSLHVKGTMTVAINGQLRELEADNAQVQIFVKHGRQIIRTIKGKVLIGDKHGFKKLNFENVAAKAAPENENADAIPELSTAPYVHVWQVGDYYAPADSSTENGTAAQLPAGSAIRLRAEPRAWVNLPTNVSWFLVGSPQHVYGELSDDSSFNLVKDAFEADSRSLHAHFQTAHLGENFVHLSIDHEHWSAPQSFRVLTAFLKRQVPRVTVAEQHVYLLGNTAVTTVRVQAPTGPSAKPSYIVEMSRDANFAQANTRAVWLVADASGASELRVTLSDPDRYYFRARSVNAANQISDLSNSVSVLAERPQLPDAPVLSSNEIHMTVGDYRILAWPASERASKYSVHIVNVVSGTSTDLTVAEPALRLAPQMAGIYDLQIASVDRFYRHSSRFANVRLLVSPRPIVKTLPPAVLPREPAQSESVIMTYNPPTQENWNQQIYRSHVEFDFGEVSMYSRDLATVSGQIPTAAVAGVHWLNWFGANGVEGNVYSKVADVSVPTGDGFSPLDLEIRYERRWRPTVHLLNIFEPLQFALISGLEIYRNSYNGYYSPGFTLAKLGASVEVPVFERCSAGGNFLVGENPDATNLYEGSIYGNYYYKKNWSFGLGYRVQLMNAGSTYEAPTQLPYREGASEAYTVLRWLY